MESPEYWPPHKNDVWAADKGSMIYHVLDTSKHTFHRRNGLTRIVELGYKDVLQAYSDVTLVYRAS